MVCQVLASGSAGNCYLLKGKKESLILECGIKAGEIKKGLEYDLSGVCGCLCTHEHKDHSQAMKDMISLGIDVYASRGTLEALGIKSHRAKEIKPEREYKIGGFWVLPFLVEHDAREPLGFLIRHEEMGKLVFLTDTYTCPYRFLGVHHFLVEANYKRELIRDEVIADRLLKSHMEIEKTLDFLKANVSKETRTILLIHLSKKNAEPDEFVIAAERLLSVPVRAAFSGLCVDLEGK